jgi:hypothetical protein
MIELKEQVPGTLEEQLPGTLEEQLPGTLKKQLKHPTLEFNKLDINLNRHVFISGQTQSGKSVSAKFIFASLPKETKAIFYDYKHDPNHARFITHFPVFTELNDIEKHFESTKRLFGGQKDMRVIYQPKRIESDVIKTHSLENPNWKKINELANYVYRTGNIILFIDEIAPFTSPHNLPPALYDCYIMGASRGVTVISITQRPNVVHNTMISEAYTRILFRQELEADRTKLKGIVGGEVADQLHELPNETFIISYIGKDYERGHLNIPQKLKHIL